ncbi:organic hydroperoxide resistance protein [Pseudonocardia sp. GCM10023141]|uniref:organic hydroperoxide resistance protein n=1 Tax=Pseudonocardia sp. GCM10023141 TaxID=3252653 RepID=UPI003621973E
MANAIYTAAATSAGDGRNGHVRSSDGIIDQDVKMPPALGGPGGATNPEQLFAAAYATCFHSALRQVAKGKKVAVPEGTTVDAAVGIGSDDSGFSVSAVITAHLPGLDQETADQLVEGAHQVCPYSKATRGNIVVDLKATV